jgi:hypothetical protein
MIAAFDDFGLECMGKSLKDLFASGEPTPQRPSETDETS